MSTEQPLKMIQLEINSLELLYKSYMSLVNGGGIYFSSNEDFNMGDALFLVLRIQLGGWDKKYPMHTEIIWKQSRLGRKGYGVAFSADEVGMLAKQDVEKLLGPELNSDKRTFTM